MCKGDPKSDVMACPIKPQERCQWRLRYSVEWPHRRSGVQDVLENVSAKRMESVLTERSCVRQEWQHGICDSVTNQNQQELSPIEIEINLSQLFGIQLGESWNKFNFFQDQQSAKGKDKCHDCTHTRIFWFFFLFWCQANLTLFSYRQQIYLWTHFCIWLFKMFTSKQSRET